MPLKPNPVCWFEIPVADMDRAKAFYESAFDTELALNEMPAADGLTMKMAWFPMEMNTGGATGTLMQHPHYTPSHEGTLVYLSVDDIPATLAKIEAAGGQAMIPETPIGEHGFIAIFGDSEGNRVALHRRADG